MRSLETKLYRAFGSWTFFNVLRPLKMACEKLVISLAWKLPHTMVFWAGIRLLANATGGPFGAENVSATTMVNAIERWSHRVGGDRSLRRA